MDKKTTAQIVYKIQKGRRAKEDKKRGIGTQQ